MTRWLEDDVEHDRLLMHYVDNAQRTAQSVDQLGNFLMGFGVLALGYLLQADLSLVAEGALGVGGADAQAVSLLTLGAWGVAVALLTTFVLIYIFGVIAGRAVHAEHGREDGIGEVLDVPADLDWRRFIENQRTFQDFLHSSYRAHDRERTESLLYARWSYMRFLALKKLAGMQRMRRLLGAALLAGVAFKVLLVYHGAIV